MVDHFNEYLEAHFEALAEVYRRDAAAAFDPTVIVVTLGGEVIALEFGGPYWEEYKYEQLALAASRLRGMGIEVAAVFMATEAWMSQYPINEVPKDRPRPSQDPQRQEVIMVTGLSADRRQSGHIMAVIERDGVGLATIGEPVRFEEGLYKDYLLEHFLKEVQNVRVSGF